MLNPYLTLCHDKEHRPRESSQHKFPTQAKYPEEFQGCCSETTVSRIGSSLPSPINGS